MDIVTQNLLPILFPPKTYKLKLISIYNIYSNLRERSFGHMYDPYYISNTNVV